MILVTIGAFFGGVAFAVLLSNIVGRWLSAPGYSGPESDHFDGEHFANEESVQLPNFRMGVRYLLTTRPGKWEKWRDNPPVAPPPERVGSGALRVTFINHATTLIQLDGQNILTDPIWSERASPFEFAGPRRHHAAGIALTDLPPIDLVLVSHNHYDHLNIPTLKALRSRHDPDFVVGLGNQRLLERHGFERVHELDWESSVDIGALSITGQPSRHFSGRGFSDRQRTLWMSFFIDGRGGPVYFAGDTAYGGHFEKTARKLAAPRMAILPIGAYEPQWFMRPVHLNPAEAVQAHFDLGAHASLAMHYGTFRLSEEGQDQPLDDLRKALAERGVSEENFWILSPGESRQMEAE